MNQLVNTDDELDKAVMIAFLYGIQSDMLPADEVRHRMAGFRGTKGYREAVGLLLVDRKKHELDARISGMRDGMNMYPNAAIDKLSELKAEREKL